MAAARSRPGPRPDQSVPRYDSGRRKPQGDPRGPAAWNRLRDHRTLYDPLLSTQLGRLSPKFHGLLTDAQVEAGNLVGRIYGAYARYHGSRWAAKSPSYMRSYGGGERGDPNDPDEIARERWAVRRWERLQGIVDALPAAVKEARNNLEKLCVEDEPIPAANIPSIRALLDRIGVRFHVAKAREQRAAIAVSGRRPHRPSARDHIPDHTKQGWVMCTRQQNPDWDDARLEEEWIKLQRIIHALRARDAHRRSKVRR